MVPIPFNVPAIAGRELEYLQQVFAARAFSGNGAFTARCHDWLRQRIGESLLTHSCTAALEMAAISGRPRAPAMKSSCRRSPFASTANASVLPRRGVPVFVDIRADTLNLDGS